MVTLLNDTLVHDKLRAGDTGVNKNASFILHKQTKEAVEDFNSSKPL